MPVIGASLSIAPRKSDRRSWVSVSQTFGPSRPPLCGSKQARICNFPRPHHCKAEVRGKCYTPMVKDLFSHETTRQMGTTALRATIAGASLGTEDRGKAGRTVVRGPRDESGSSKSAARCLVTPSSQMNPVSAPPQSSPVGIQLFNKLIRELGEAPGVGFIGYQLAKLSPFFFPFLLNCHAGSKATTLPNQQGRPAPNTVLQIDHSAGLMLVP